MSDHYALEGVQGEQITNGGVTRWHIDKGILHVSHSSSDYGDLEELHYRLVRVEQTWVEATAE